MKAVSFGDDCSYAGAICFGETRSDAGSIGRNWPIVVDNLE